MKIMATRNGPYLIESSGATLKKGDREEKVTGKMVALCRCGHSANKPFCDGTHKKVGFEAEACELEVE